MPTPSDRERELRALDALLVSQLRTCGADEVDIEHLPELTDDERNAMDSLDADFASKLLKGQIYQPTIAKLESEKTEYAFAGDESLAFGMNRAKDIDEAAAKEIERKRKEIIERMKGEKGGKDDRSSDGPEQGSAPSAR